MEQSKPFLTIDEQISLLEGRGVVFHDRDAAARFLLAYNYYSVVNGYKDAFLDEDKTNQHVEVYREGTSFEQIMSLYYFDRALRRITLGMLLDAEETMRTAVVYAFCEQNRDHDDYLDPASYCTSREYRSKKDYSKNLIRLLYTLQGISENRQHKRSIGHYIKKYRSVPLWVLSRCITFGSMSAFYDLQKLKVKQRACEYLADTTGNEISPNQLRQAYKVLSQFRNICAHEERLYCATVGKNGDMRMRELVELLGLVSTKEDMAAYAKQVTGILELMRKPSMPREIVDDVTDKMGMDETYLSDLIS